jgi:hypothetical protein
MKITKQVSMNPLTVCLSLLILEVAGFGGMSVVWMRTKISQSADRISQVEIEQKKVNRRLQDIGAKIAESHTPEVLKAGIPASVRPSLREQIIWVPDSYGGPQQLASSNP